jgi:hypoxanthine phosphoribosyltransferase
MNLCSQATAAKLLDNSHKLYDHSTISNVIETIAAQIEQDWQQNYPDTVPILLTIMNGALFFTAELLHHIRSAVFVDSLQVTRYLNTNIGHGHVHWLKELNTEQLRKRVVYLIDDILDEGHTLAAVQEAVLAADALACKIVVLIDKNIDKPKPVTPQFVGLRAPNQFLFGFGMDLYGLYRQLPDIYTYNGN